jgi:serine/threonine-protein kinase HipA
MIIKYQVDTIRLNWTRICDEAALTTAERQFLWHRQFLNPFAFYGAPPGIRNDATTAENWR